MSNGPDSDPRNGSGSDPRPCCVHLRCKSMYYRPDERPGLLHSSDRQVYWCGQTLEPLGPDDQSVAPSLCGAARGCFEEEV